MNLYPTDISDADLIFGNSSILNEAYTVSSTYKNGNDNLLRQIERKSDGVTWWYCLGRGWKTHVSTLYERSFSSHFTQDDIPSDSHAAIMTEAQLGNIGGERIIRMKVAFTAMYVIEEIDYK